MTIKVSLTLNDRVPKIVRGNEKLSPRVDQVIDRYTEMLRLERKQVRALFTDKEWPTLLAAAPECKGRAIGVQLAMARALETHPKVAAKVEELSSADRFVLLEILESEIIAGGA